MEFWITRVILARANPRSGKGELLDQGELLERGDEMLLYIPGNSCDTGESESQV